MIFLFLFSIHMLISVSVTEAIPQELTTQNNQVQDNYHLYNSIRDLQKTTTLLAETVARMTNERKAESATIKRLKLQLYNQASEINALRIRTSTTEKDILECNAGQIAATHQQKNTSEYEERNNKTDIPDTVNSSDGLQNIEYRVAESPKQVPKSAFYARAQSSVAVSDNEVIAFQDVELNIGNNFDSQFGVFTCTIPGTYVFTHDLSTHIGKFLQNVIVKNGVAVAHMYANDGGGSYGAATTSCILNLDGGDRVWVKVDRTVHSSGIVVYPQFTSFSGFLLYPIY